MGKSRAEIQKAYRERRKAEKGSKYLKKEANRIKKYYVPTVELPCEKLRKRREKIRTAMRKSRQKESTDTMHVVSPANNDTAENEAEPIDLYTDQGPCDSTSAEAISSCLLTSTPTQSTSTSNDELSARKLVVKMGFQSNRSRRGRRRKPEELKVAEIKIRKLNHDLETARRKNSTLRQRLSRIDRYRLDNADMSTCSAPHSTVDLNPKQTPERTTVLATLTPRSRSKTILRSSGLSPKRHKLIAKKLMLHESMVDDLKETEPAVNMVCGKTAKRSRQYSAVSKALKVDRYKLLRKIRGKTILQRRRMIEKARVKERVIQFMERDDNSACLPGKADCSKTVNGTKQKRVLNDLLCNLHKKFRSENLDIKINATTFGSYRPANIKLVHYSTRKTCLCQRHQNLALKVKGLKSLRITDATTPDSYIKQGTDEELLSEIQQHECTHIKYTEWQRLEVEHKGRKTKRMQVVQIEKSKADFIEVMKKEIPDFRNHCQRVKVQYEEVKRLKDKLPADQTIIQMDFAENYLCSHADEVQSAYFDKGAVTLHPAVIYYKTVDNTLQHESYIIVSDTPHHNSGTVFAFIKTIVPIAYKLVPLLKTIHYVTDSPTSQYRNKHMFYVVANHHDLFKGVTASWQYFEAGHGKGPCDGVGGTAKRQADSAVKRQICSIQNADDFFAWGSNQLHSNIKYIFVPNTECLDATNYLKQLNIKPVKGTMMVHSVAPQGNNCIALRNTSCFCDECYTDGEFHVRCSGWNMHTFQITGGSGSVDSVDNGNRCHLQQQTPNNDPIAEVVNADENASVCIPCNIDDANESCINENLQQYATNAYVASLYDENWYIGKILEYDLEDNTYQISFMTQGSNKRSITFKWPEKKDILWLPYSAILCSVDEPKLHAKTRLLFKLSEEDLKKVLRKYPY